MEDIKKLREQTGAGMVDCQKALKEAAGDLEKAVEILRKSGIAKAAKRTDRETNEGIIKVLAEAGKAYVVELNSETDFVAKNDKFQAFADDVLNVIKTNNPENLEALLATPMSNGISIKDSLDNLSGVIGEKLAIKDFAIVSGASVAAYSHLGGKIGVLVALDKANSDELALDVAMQVAATAPRYLNSSEVDPTELEKEKDIYRDQLLKEGKPEAMIEKILLGKVDKYYTEVCLLNQEYIKDDKKKVSDILGDTSIVKFVRYSLS
jgi:elongation factor Ts